MPSFTLRQLEIFNAAVTSQSFVMAANFLNISTPAVSKQIQALEAELGVKLFKKAERKMVITEEGKIVLAQANVILEESKKLTSMVSLGLDSEKPLLKFAIGHLFFKLIFNLLKDFLNQNFIQYDVSIEPFKQQFTKLEQGKVDFVISGFKHPSSKFRVIPFKKIKFLLACSQTNSLAIKQDITIGAIKNTPYLQFKPKETLQKSLLPKYELAKRTFSQIIQLESYYAIREAIKADLGIGILPETLVEDEMKQLKILALKEFRFTRQLYLITSKEKSPIREQFIDFAIR